MVTRSSFYSPVDSGRYARLSSSNSNGTGGGYHTASFGCVPSYLSSYAERKYHQLPSHAHDVARAVASMAEHVHRQQTDEPSAPRKRIAVACGRCRKRKIRCSGDPGAGLPCTNCKNAGHNECLFLRVSSTETPLRAEGGFSYNLDASRALADRGRSVSSSHAGSLGSPALGPAYTHDVTLLGSGGHMSSYRPASSAIHQPMTAKNGYYNVPAEWSHVYGDETVDCGIVAPSYSTMTTDAAVGMLPAYHQWPVATSHARGHAISSYYQTPSMSPTRQSCSADPAANFSVSHLVASLPPSNAGPVSRGLGVVDAVPMRPTVNTSSQAISGHAHHDSEASSASSASTAHTSPSSPSAEIATSSYNNAYNAHTAASAAATAEYIFADSDRANMSQGGASHVDALSSYTYNIGSSGGGDWPTTTTSSSSSSASRRLLPTSSSVRRASATSATHRETDTYDLAAATDLANFSTHGYHHSRNPSLRHAQHGGGTAMAAPMAPSPGASAPAASPPSTALSSSYTGNNGSQMLRLVSSSGRRASDTATGGSGVGLGISSASLSTSAEGRHASAVAGYAALKG